MKIQINKNLVDFIPENATEKAAVTDLWNFLVDCVKFNKKLVPVGEYSPIKNDVARFVVEE